MEGRLRRLIGPGMLVACAALAVLVVLVWPLLFSYSGFSGDWEHGLWLVWHQGLTIEAARHPTLFLESAYSLFNPIFAFYGGTLFSLGGALSLLWGPVQAYVLVYVLDFAAAFSGWYWLSRMAGLSRWMSLVPGLIAVTSAYYLVIVYVQGDWPEFTGISMIAPMVAAALSVLRADRARYGAKLALAVSSILFFGAHNITILLGLTTLGLTGLAVVAFVPAARTRLTRRAIGRVAGIVVPGAMVSAWYLLPAVTYASRTHVGRDYTNAQEALEKTVWLVGTRHLFTFSRTSGIGLPPPYYLVTALPVVAIAWVILGALILPWGNRDRTWTRLLLICSGMAVLIALVMTHVGLILALPRQYSLIQFSYRLEIYVVLLLCAAVLAALALARTSPRRVRIWMWLAVPVCAASLIGAVQQMSDYPDPGQDRYTTLQYFGEVETGANIDYQDASERRIPGSKLPKLDFALEAVKGDTVSAATRLAPGTLATTNIVAGSYLVHVSGAKPVGIDSQTGNMVLSIGPPPGGAQASRTTGTSQEATVTVSTGHSLPIVLGRLLTLCGLALLALQLLLAPARRLLSRRRRSDGAA